MPETQFNYLGGGDKTFRILVLSHNKGLNISWYWGSKGEVQDNWYVNANSAKDNGI